ncbi:MAG: efflux RND transporter permease subunit [bacterium]
MINRLINFSLKNRIIILISAVILLLLGIFLFTKLPVDVYPNLNAPVVTVITENHGMAPEDIETLITFPLESSFNSLPYVRRVRSSSTLGLSKIHIEFEYGTNIYFARQLVNEKLQMVAPHLPNTVEPPFIGPISSMFADAVEFTLKGEDLYQVRDFTEWTLKPRLQTVSGVSNVINQGGFLKQYHVLLNPDKMLTYDIEINTVMEALQQNNINSSGGFIETESQEKIVRGLGRVNSIADIQSIPLKENQGVPITIRDVAQVKIGAYVRRGSAGESGEEVVVVTVQNQYNSNVMETIKGVEDVLINIKKQVAGQIKIEQFYNQLEMITKSIRNVSNAIILGGFLVIFVLYIFLNNLKSTIIVALAIPLSAVFAFIFFRLFHLSINIMTLGGLAIGLGIIVDSSIIMVENIYRHIQEGKESFTCALLNGAQEVGSPIFFAILILLAVFAPVFTLQGIEGRMFIPLTFAVSASVLGSLIISLTITPVLASLVFKNLKQKVKPGILLRILKKAYNPLLHYTLTHARKVGIICIIIVAVGIGLSFFIGSEFMPELDESALIVDVLLPPETSLKESTRIASRVAATISSLPEVTRVIRRTGKARAAEHAAPVYFTHTYCDLIPKEKRKKSIHRIKNEIRSLLKDLPGANIQINAPLQHRINHLITGTKSSIAVKIFGDNINSIIDLCQQFRDKMKSVKGVTDLQIEQISGVPQLQIKFKRDKLAIYGLSIKDVSRMIEVAIKGKVATELIETQKRYDIFVRYQKEFRDTERQIANLMLETRQGYHIPLSEVAEVRENLNPVKILKEDALRRGMVECNVSGRDMGSVVSEIKDKVKDLNLPEGYFYTFGGTYENQARALKQLTLVVIFTIIIVFFLLIISFRSLKNSLLIIINIPLALAGGLIILLITNSTLSVPSIVGFIALIGIAVQDGIVLTKHITHYRQTGLSVREAVVQAGNNKLRPVLMTTFTTMLGLLPLAVRNVTGSEIQKPLAFVIMFGLLFSTLLTLLVLPALYTVMNRSEENKSNSNNCV